MILHCTKKLATKLSDVSAVPLVETSPMGSWHGLLYAIERRQCIIFCHDISRYILFLPGVKKEHFAELGQLHRELFIATLAGQGVPAVNIKRVELTLGPMRYDSITDRSVLGSINIARSDMSWIIEPGVLGRNPVDVSVNINDRPCTIRGRWLRPKDVMREQIAKITNSAESL